MHDPLIETLEEKVARTDSGPGVYLMRDDQGRVIYVGKARNLKKRLSSYFKKGALPDVKTRTLVNRIAAFDTLVTGTENEALILESNLIKRYRPRYNVILKDDKRYPSLRLDIQHPYPGLSIVRKIQRDGALYFGPYPSAQAVYQTLKIINKNFRLRKCRNREVRKRERPCLHCQLQGCLAPCCREISPEQYDEAVKEVMLFLKGRTSDLIDKLRQEMETAAAQQQFEKAAELRDRMFSLQRILERQVAVTTDFKDRDVIALSRSGPLICVTTMFIRGGFLLGSRNDRFPDAPIADADVIGLFLRQYYEKSPIVPEEILISDCPEDLALLEEWLTGLRGARARILAPKRGPKLAILEMAKQNALNGLREMLAAVAASTDLMERLQRCLSMDRLPRRIECFDNSNLYGHEPVSSLVVFQDGRALKSAYRRYRIQTPGGPDDYAHMAEVVQRRFCKSETEMPKPDLLMVDGGRGQLNIALSVLRDMDVEGAFQVIGIAKPDETRGETQDKIYMPGRSNPILFGKEPDLLLFLQRIRDEAHRFAIDFHRQRRNRAALQSALDGVPGIGAKRKAMLLKHFGGVKKIRAATPDELSALPGMNRTVARALLTALGKNGAEPNPAPGQGTDARS